MLWVNAALQDPRMASAAWSAEAIRREIEEDNILKKADENQDGSNGGPLAFAWETLPELAKNRWEEAVAFNVTIDNQLNKAKADRTQAEIERQRIAREILDATKEVCEEIIVDGKRALDSARRMEAEAGRHQSDSQVELEVAKAVRIEAEGYRDKIMAEVDQECKGVKDRASQEVQRMLGQADVMRAAVQEELETQRIYSETARLRAESQEVLTLIRVNRGEPMAPQLEAVEENLANMPVTGEQQDENQIDSPSIDQVSDDQVSDDQVSVEETQQSSEAENLASGNKPSRKPSPVK